MVLALLGKDWHILFRKACPKAGFLHKNQGAFKSCWQELEEWWFFYLVYLQPVRPESQFPF